RGIIRISFERKPLYLSSHNSNGAIASIAIAYLHLSIIGEDVGVEAINGQALRGFAGEKEVTAF
ncbi:hypothetical protein, partial [Lyngbya sp. CCY1209]|uniref:hypothetical protein n=1 Tax=Lyngbya sp. CCY1209 TaxID=2886103 RepID=UPI002D207516